MYANMKTVVISDAEQQKWARTLLKGEMHRKGMTSEDLARELYALGFLETASGVQAKVSRGTFSFTFLAACMEAMGVKTVEIDLLKFVYEERHSPTLKGTSRNEIDRLGRYVRLPWSKDEPVVPHATLLLPTPRYSSKRKGNALQCGKCLTELFMGWRIGDAKRVFDGQPVVGVCSVCDSFISIPGSTVEVTVREVGED